MNTLTSVMSKAIFFLGWAFDLLDQAAQFTMFMLNIGSIALLWIKSLNLCNFGYKQAQFALLIALIN